MSCMDPLKFGIDELRYAVRLFANCDETFNQNYTSHELLKMSQVMWRCAWDITPDRWTPQQIDAAIKDNRTPQFIEGVMCEFHALNVTDCCCRDCRQKSVSSQPDTD